MISVIILTKDGGHVLDDCLNMVFSQVIDSNFEVIVIDSESDKVTLNILKKYPIKLINIKQVEFSHGKTRNLGADISNGGILVYLNQDAIPIDKKWLKNLISPFNNKKISAVYGKQVPGKNVNLINDYRIKYFYNDDKKIKYKKNNNPIHRDDIAFSTVNCAIRKKVWQDIPFNDNFKYAEDTDFSYKLINNYYRIAYEPKAAVFHSHNYTLSDFFVRYFDTGISYKKSGILNLMLKIEGKGKEYIINELKYLIKKKSSYLIPLALFSIFCQYTGFKLGCLEEKIPIRLKRKFSKYWY